MEGFKSPQEKQPMTGKGVAEETAEKEQSGEGKEEKAAKLKRWPMIG